jgi:hypothetical protein
MNCHNVESILASGASELTAEVLSHLETCPACARLRSGEEDFQKLLDLAATVQVEPPQWLWHQIDTRIRHNRPESAWPEFVRGVGRLLEVPDLRPAWVALVLALVLTASLTGLRPRSDGDRLLAELTSYELDVPENPFVQEPIGDANPFYGWGGQER